MFKNGDGDYKIRLQRDKVTTNNKWRYNDFEGHVFYLAPSEYQVLGSPMKIELTVRAFENHKEVK